MTNREALSVAMAQSALESGCAPEDFLRDGPVVVEAVSNPGARRYLRQPFLCDLTSYGGNVVASCRRDLMEPVRAYLARTDAAHAMETPDLHALDALLAPFGLRTKFMAEYFLPDFTALAPLPAPCELRVLTPSDFTDLYLPQWSNALSEKRPHLDRLAVGAYENGQLIGLAGASADCDAMWQIGVDVLPGYRRRGVASAMTSRLAWEIARRGLIPFYCAAWCNLPSVRNALRSGFRPAWVQLTAWEIYTAEA